MSQTSKTVRAHVALLLFAIAVGLVLWFATALSLLVVWVAIAVIAVIAVAAIVVYVRAPRMEAARKRAWDGSFSFATVVARRRAEALTAEAAERSASVRHETA
jgi:ABC-type bacteriocin/lantibiotic exporter with double-glycine peptidase domain